MNLLSNSNGVHKIKKKKLSVLNICKRATICVLILLLFGLTIQMTTNLIDNTRLESRFKYVRIDGKKMEYKIKGNGSYTVVFDGSIGSNVYEWDKICKTLEEDKDITTFIYHRRGYGFNDGGEIRTFEEQAKDLRALLKKSGATAPYILVGEEYGSLVTTNFVKLYPDLVSGVVLIDPISEEKIKTKEFKNSIKYKYYRSKIESIGSSFALTSLLSKIGLTMENDTFKNSIKDNELQEFNALENKKNYKEAVHNEIKNLYKGTSNSQSEGLLENTPFYIITADEDENIKKMGDSELTTIYNKEITDSPYSVLNPDSVVTGVNTVLKEAKKLAKK